LGVRAWLGRTIVPEDDRLSHGGGNPVAVIGYGLWQRRFGGDPAAVGKTLSVEGRPFRVVGVLPQGFYGLQVGQTLDFAIPIAREAQIRPQSWLGQSDYGWLSVVGRLQPGVSRTRARADLAVVFHQFLLAHAGGGSDPHERELALSQRLEVSPAANGLSAPRDAFSHPLLILMAAVALVLLIACANVANLLLVRATGRAREFAIRAALGANQARVVRQLLTESILLSLVGGALGLMIAAWGTRAALRVLPDALPRSNEIHLDLIVLLFTLGVSIFVGIVFGLVPALKTASRDLHETLKEGGRGGSGLRHRTQNTFVVIEMALALVLLVGAGLMIRSLAVLSGVSPGFNPHNALEFNIGSAQPLGGTPDQIRAVFLALHDRLASVPAVQSVSLEVGATPMEGDSEFGFWLAGQPKPASDTDMKMALFYSVQPDYLTAMGIPLLRGRFLTSDDDQHSPPVIVIDQEFAHLAFGNDDPLGKRVNFEILGTAPEVVGVVGHVKQWGLDEGSHSPVLAQFYFPISQIPDQFMPLLARGVGAVVRTNGSPLATVGGLRHALEEFDSQAVMYGTQPLDEVISDSIASRRFAMILLGVFAALALLLSAIGIYGVISYIVGQRVHEIGIRLALGAHPADVLRLILGQGTKLALLGVAIGIAAALALTRLMTKMIFGVSAHDPLTFAGVAIILVIVALAACYIPARRAMRTDPMVALRYE
jgi:predicted permease